MLVTVATPTYNRASLLPRLYQSLCSQTCSDFEWVIIDDGSTDNTREVVEGFVKEDKITIRYIHKENGGKHTALNRGVKEAKGKWFFIVDSDDYLCNNSIEIIKKEGAELIDSDKYAGLSGIDIFKNGASHTVFPSVPYIDASAYEISTKYGVRGDLAEVFKTHILKEFPFPEIPNERFCPEVLVWNRIANSNRILRFLPQPIKIIEYLPDGLTSSITKLRMRNPIASTLCYSEMSKFHPIFSQRIKSAVNYWRFYYCLKSKREIRVSFGWRILAPIGFILHVKDKKRNGL